MSGCLAPPLSVYSSSLLIYSSPLVIYSCCLPFYQITFWSSRCIHERFIQMLYPYDWLLPFLIWTFGHNNFTRAYCTFPEYIFPTNFFMVLMVYHILHTQPFLFIGVLCYICPNILLNVFYGILFPINLSSFFTLLAFLRLFLDCLFHCPSPYFPNFHILPHYLFFFFNNHSFILIFNLILLG